MISGFVAWMSRINKAYGQTMQRHEKLENFRSLLFMVGLFSAAWAFAWNAHIIGPWLDAFLGIGPHDIDSPGKVRWRRMWSTAICLPGIVSVVILYFLNIRDRKRYQSQIEARRKEMEERGKEGKEGKEISIHPPIDSSSPKPPSVNSKDQTEAEQEG